MRRQWIINAVIACFLALVSFHTCVGPMIFINERDEPTLPQRIPIELPISSSSSYACDETSYAIPYNYASEFTIWFPTMDSVQGLWTASDPLITINTPYQTKIRGTTEESREQWPWGSSIIVSSPYEKEKDFSPFLKVVLAIDQKYHGQYIDTTATLTVRHPELHDGGFINETNYFRRNIRFLVVSPDEYSMLEKHLEWENTISWNQDPPMRIMGAVIFAALIFWMIISIVWAINKKEGNKETKNRTQDVWTENNTPLPTALDAEREKVIDQYKQDLATKTERELLKIWNEGDTGQYSEEELEAVRRILNEHGHAFRMRKAKIKPPEPTILNPEREKLVDQYKKDLVAKTERELLKIWKKGDKKQYSEDQLEAVRRILNELGHAFRARK